MRGDARVRNRRGQSAVSINGAQSVEEAKPMRDIAIVAPHTKVCLVIARRAKTPLHGTLPRARW